MAQQ
jgi:hypothetical protein